MKLQIENKYQIIVDKVYNKEVEFNFEKYIKDNDIEVVDKADLEDYIYNYVDDCNLLYNEGDIDHLNFNSDDNITILNLKEILEEYSYLIVPKKELTCCEKSAKYNSYNICLSINIFLFYFLYKFKVNIFISI